MINKDGSMCQHPQAFAQYEYYQTKRQRIKEQIEATWRGSGNISETRKRPVTTNISSTRVTSTWKIACGSMMHTRVPRR